MLLVSVISGDRDWNEEFLTKKKQVTVSKLELYAPV